MGSSGLHVSQRDPRRFSSSHVSPPASSHEILSFFSLPPSSPLSDSGALLVRMRESTTKTSSLSSGSWRPHVCSLRHESSSSQGLLFAWWILWTSPWHDASSSSSSWWSSLGLPWSPTLSDLLRYACPLPLHPPQVNFFSLFFHVSFAHFLFFNLDSFARDALGWISPTATTCVVTINAVVAIGAIRFESILPAAVDTLILTLSAPIVCAA